MAAHGAKVKAIHHAVVQDLTLLPNSQFYN